MAVTGSDDFNRSDNSALGSNWQQNRGNHDIASNRMKTGTSASGLNHSAFTGTSPASADYYVKATKRNTTGGSSNHEPGIGARQKSASFGSFDAYVAELNFTSGKVELYRWKSGGATLLADYTATLAHNTDYVLELQVSGVGATVSLTVKFDGSTVITYDDTSGNRLTATEYAGVWENVASASASNRAETDDFEFGTLTAQVDKDLALLWHTRAQATKDVGLLWHTKALATKDLALLWHVRAAVTKDVGLLWDTYAQATKDLALLWHVGGKVDRDLALVWDTYAQATKDLGLVWHTRAAVTVDLALLWDVLVDSSSVTKDLDLLWHTRALVTKDLGLAWHTRAQATKDLSLAWQVKQAVMKEVSLAWRVLASLDKDLDLRWRTRVLTTRDLALLWHVAAMVERDLTLRWNVGAGSATAGYTPTAAWADAVPSGAWRRVAR